MALDVVNQFSHEYINKYSVIERESDSLVL